MKYEEHFGEAAFICNKINYQYEGFAESTDRKEWGRKSSYTCFGFRDS